MTLIPHKIHDGNPRNSIGQLVSVTTQYSGGILGNTCRWHQYRSGPNSWNKDTPETLDENCKGCQAYLRARKRWTNYLQKELTERG